MRNKSIILFLFFLISYVNSNAQQEKLISLDDVLSIVKKNNATIKISDKDYQVAKAEFNQTNAFLLPSIAVSHTAIYTTNPLMAFGSKLNQEILTATDFDPQLLNNPNAVRNFATKIEVKQPLLNLDGLFMRKAAKSKMTSTELQSVRTKDYILLEVKKAYMQLQLAYKAVEVMEKTKNAALENQKIAENNFKQGYIQKADLLLVNVHVIEIENQFKSSESNLKNASDYLLFLMGDENNSTLKPNTELKENLNLTSVDKEISTKRADIKSMEKYTAAYSNIYKASKFSYLPRLNAFGSYEMYDQTLFGTSAKGYTVGAQLSWDLFEGFKRIGKIQKSKAEFDKAEISFQQYKNKSQLEYNNAIRQLTDAENNLNSTKLALEQSKEALRIRSNRFQQGLEKTADILMAETQYMQKQLEYLQTIFNYNFTKYYVEFLTN